VKEQIEKKLAGKFEQESLDHAFKKIEVKYSAEFENIFEKLGPYLYVNIFKVNSLL
jgi:hypothetical protein